ncbi:DUF5130 family protein [Nocardioides acrostichi]|uniref:DUF5130 family protein n=1 Tax=Nocardioides acrostichi TaxID=2784339 RepID=A0A930USQ5_9ACTN|nr:DUF5130 family protein [Nocardioides acrostichi]MBF4160143.1 DUF5130 family protein [Nocardioides acrostichi]
MAAGDPLSSRQRATLDAAIRRAEQSCRYEFSVFVGTVDGADARTFARRLHASLTLPARSVLVMVDPTRRAIEIVTGEQVRSTLSDREVDLIVLHMQSDFASGDLAGGLRRGVEQLAEHARAPRTLHA